LIAALDGILETALYVDDLDRASAFYGGVLGLDEVTRVDGRHLFFRCGQAMLLLFIADGTSKPPTDPAMPVPAHGASGAGHVCFRVAAEALAQWRSRLEAASIEIEADFRWPNGARSVYFRDPAGNSLEFAEPKLWGFE
jgi:catechol 2,3-dioxygenase-like lactoylglutathione lyase family enzyme